VATRIPTAVRNAVTNVVVALVDADVGPASIQIRSGPQPANANDAASGTLLATVTLADPAFSAAVVGVATLDATPVLSTVGVAAGTAGWFRVLDNSGDTVMDGAVTLTGGGGEMELNTLTISVGVTFEITAGTLTEPATTP
jgi:hypothetical protein